MTVPPREPAPQLEDQHRQAQKMEALGRLAGGVAHDFNNLLTVINGYAQLMLSDSALPERFRPYLSEVCRASERGESLTRQLLAFSRRQFVKLEPFDLNRLVEGVSRLLTRLIGEEVSLRLDLSSEPVAVHADLSQMELALMNLAVNARDAMPRGGVLTFATAPRLLSRTLADASHGELPPGEYAELAVSDTGTGMADEVKSHLFEPFFTTKEAGRGTGLGLAAVYGVVKMAGGGILIESAAGVGTTFRLLLPRLVLGAASPARPVLARVSAHEAGTREAVLVVEDDPCVRRMVTSALHLSGYRVVEVDGGEAALSELRSASCDVDLMLADVVMPGLGGSDLAEAARRLRPSLRVAFVSGHADEAIRLQGIDPERTPVLRKPFTTESMARAVRRALDGGAAGERASE